MLTDIFDGDCYKKKIINKDTLKQPNNFDTISKPVMVAKWRARLLTVREVSRSNPSNLPLLQTWHVGNMTGRHAVYMLIQCTSLLVEKAGVTPDVTFRMTACKQERVQARYPLWI